jgi:hypothetical protein
MPCEDDIREGKTTKSEGATAKTYYEEKTIKEQ